MECNKFDAAKTLVAASDRVCGPHRYMEQTTDFVALQEELTASEKGKMTQENSWQHQDLTPGNAFYLVARNKDDDTLAAFCGVRLYDLRRESFAEFLRRQYARLYGDGKFLFSTTDVHPELSRMRGRIGYMGDFYIWPHGGRKPAINPTDFMTCVYALGVLEFDPDYMLGFVQSRKARRGLTATYVAAKQYNHVVFWDRHVPGRSDDDMMICMDREDLGRVFEISRRTSHEVPISAPVVAVSR